MGTLRVVDLGVNHNKYRLSRSPAFEDTRERMMSLNEAGSNAGARAIRRVERITGGLAAIHPNDRRCVRFSSRCAAQRCWLRQSANAISACVASLSLRHTPCVRIQSRDPAGHRAPGSGVFFHTREAMGRNRTSGPRLLTYCIVMNGTLACSSIRIDGTAKRISSGQRLTWCDRKTESDRLVRPAGFEPATFSSGG